LGFPTGIQVIEMDVDSETRYFLAWDAMTGAAGYRIYLRGDFAASWASIYIRDGFTNMLDISFFGPGLYQIQIVSISDNRDEIFDSRRSAIITHIVDDVMTPPDDDPIPPTPPGYGDNPYGLPRLPRPINVAVSQDGIISWNNVEYAVGFAVYINTMRMAEISDPLVLSFDIETLNLLPGSYFISVVSLGDLEYHFHSFSSLGVMYHIEAPSPFLPPDDDDASLLLLWILLPIIGLLALSVLVLAFQKKQAARAAIAPADTDTNLKDAIAKAMLSLQQAGTQVTLYDNNMDSAELETQAMEAIQKAGTDAELARRMAMELKKKKR